MNCSLNGDIYVVAIVTTTVFKLSKKIGKDILRLIETPFNMNLNMVCGTVTSVKHC